MNWMTRLRRGLAALGLALAGCTAQPPATGTVTAVRPALWEVRDSDTRIYLFGTIHMLPQGVEWRTPALEKALAESQALVVETNVDLARPQALAAELGRLGFREGLPPIVERVPPDKRAALTAAIARTGLPMAAFDRMETWAAAFTLLGLQFQTLGLSGEQGVEAVLRNRFLSAGKPIGQLETNVEQLVVFDSLSEAAQRKLLEGALETPAATRSEFDAMLRAWTRGDVDSIARSFVTEYADSPELLGALLTRRNFNWAAWIERRMAQPGTLMIAVGAGHLAGNSSVQRVLESRGYRVRRVQ